MKRLFQCIGPVLLALLFLGSGAGCSKSSRARRELKAADRDFNAEKYDNAEVEYKNVLRLSRMDPTAIGQLGRIYAKEGRQAEAASFLIEATKLDPNSLPFQLALGQVYEAFRDSTNAAQIALRILSAQPTNEDALLLLVGTAGSGQDVQRQMESLPHVRENPGYHLALGLLALRQQKLADAGSELNLALVADPKSSPTYLALGQLHLIQKQEKEAAQALQNAAAFAPLRSSTRIRYVDYLSQSGSGAEARKVLKEMTDKAPDYIPGWVALLNMDLHEKHYDAAERAADTILSRDDKNYDAMLAKANVSLGKGDPGKALIQLQRLESLYKKSPQVKYELALAYLSSRDRVKSVAALNQALVLDPSYAQAAMLLAQLDLRGGDPAAAVALLTRFTKRAPSVGQAYILLADAYIAQEKPESALAVYRNLEETFPKSPQIPMLMGMVLVSQRRIPEARQSFEHCLELAPDFLQAVDQLVNLDLAQHKYNDATAMAEAQISKMPTAAEPWEMMAKIDVARTNLPHAETSLLKAIELNPDLPGPYLMLAQVYVRGTNFEPALQKLNALVARTNDAPAFLQIGAIHEELKHFEEASDAYEKVLKINPHSIPALNNLAYIYAVRLNKIDRAYELAQVARSLRPFDPNVEDTLGWVLYEKGDYPRALALLEDSADRAPTDGEIQFHLGMTHYMMDEEDSARLSLQRAVISRQEFANKAEATNALAVLNTTAAGAGLSALPGLEKARAEHPKDPVILNRIGALQEQTGDWEKAASTYEAALKQNPDAVHILARLASLYASRLNQRDKALALATEAHNIAPDNAEINGVLGHLVYRTGDYVWSLSLLENAADRLPNQPALLYDLAWAYYSVGRVTDALSTMRNALQTGVAFAGSEDAKRFLELVDAFTTPAKAQAAAGQAKKVLQSDAKYVPALMVSGVAEELAGNYKAAQDTYSTALETLPLFSPAARQLAILDARYFNQDSHGYELAEKARSAYPDDTEVAKSLAILSYYQAKYPRSEELLQGILSSKGNDGEVYYYLGMDYHQLKKNAESRQALGRALALKIPDKLAAEARRILAD